MFNRWFVLSLVATLLALVVLLMGYLHGGICLFFALIGGALGKVRRNFWMGVRTPWTIASETVWNRTHRLAARWFVGAGVGGFLWVVLTPVSRAALAARRLDLFVGRAIRFGAGPTRWHYREPRATCNKEDLPSRTGGAVNVSQGTTTLRGVATDREWPCVSTHGLRRRAAHGPRRVATTHGAA